MTPGVCCVSHTIASILLSSTQTHTLGYYQENRLVLLRSHGKQPNIVYWGPGPPLPVDINIQVSQIFTPLSYVPCYSLSIKTSES